jgi:hypothetical protein
MHWFQNDYAARGEAFRRQVAKALELHFQALSMRAGRSVECDSGVESVPGSQLLCAVLEQARGAG